MSREKDEAITEAERQFAGVFVRARRATRERAAAVHPELTVLGYHVLSVLGRAGQQPQSALVDLLSTDKAMISRTVTHLGDLGLVARAPDPEDRRVQLVSLSEAGRDRLETVRSSERLLLRARMADWDVADIRTLAALLERVNDEVWSSTASGPEG